MSLVEINWRPEQRELRKFGIIAFAMLTVISSLLHFAAGLSICWSAGLFSLGLIIFLISLISARATRIIYLGLTLAALPIGIVISFVLLAAFYFLVLTPMGLLFRLLGRDALSRRFEPDTESYWVKRRPAESPDRYFHQF
jgi:hypothetical protein